VLLFRPSRSKNEFSAMNLAASARLQMSLAASMATKVSALSPTALSHNMRLNITQVEPPSSTMTAATTRAQPGVG